jgi:hypothetical protein
MYVTYGWLTFGRWTSVVFVCSRISSAAYRLAFLWCFQCWYASMPYVYVRTLNGRTDGTTRAIVWIVSLPITAAFSTTGLLYKREYEGEVGGVRRPILMLLLLQLMAIA